MQKIVEKHPDLKEMVDYAKTFKKHYRPRHPLIPTKENEELFKKIGA